MVLAHSVSLQVGVGEKFDGDQSRNNDHCYDDCACHGADDALPVGAVFFSRRRHYCCCCALHTRTRNILLSVLMQTFHSLSIFARKKGETVFDTNAIYHVLLCQL